MTAAISMRVPVLTAARTGAAERPSSLRPAPMLPEAGDLQSGLFAAQAMMKRASSKIALVSADAAATHREHAIEQAREAMRRAQEEAREAQEKAEWLSTIRTVATVAAVVVAAASVCCTAGLSAPGAVALVGVALSASSSYVGEATGSEELALGLALAGAALSCGAGLYSAFTTTTANTLTAGEQAVMVSAKVTAAGAEVGSGAVTIAKGRDEADAQEARADAAAHRATVRREQAFVDDAIAMLSEVETKSRRAVMTVIAVGDTISSARAATINNMRRA